MTAETPPSGCLDDGSQFVGKFGASSQLVGTEFGLGHSKLGLSVAGSTVLGWVCDCMLEVELRSLGPAAATQTVSSQHKLSV